MTASGIYTPHPGAAPLPRMLLAQTALETRLLLRNGEQVLLALVIPVGLLVLLTTVPVLDTGEGATVDFLVPGILALTVMSTAFTGQAIATGYERRYGALKRLAASPLPRWGLLASKTFTVIIIEMIQVAAVTAVGLVLGWRPEGSLLIAALLLVVGTAAFSGLGLLMAGTLRAEATLAGANLVYLVLLVTGGIVVPLDKFPAAAAEVLQFSPAAALAEGLRAVLRDGAGMPWAAVAVLLAWAAGGLTLAARTFRWE